MSRLPKFAEMGIRDVETVKARVMRSLPAGAVTIDVILEALCARLGAKYDAYDDSDKQADEARNERRRAARRRGGR
jgi:hypothetical protein